MAARTPAKKRKRATKTVPTPAGGATKGAPRAGDTKKQKVTSDAGVGSGSAGNVVESANAGSTGGAVPDADTATTNDISSSSGMDEENSACVDSEMKSHGGRPSSSTIDLNSE